MSDAQDVQATVIEESISPLARSEQWLAQARARVTELAAQYRVPEEILTDKDFKDAKASRTAVRKDAKELDDERKRMTREMDDALKRFRADVKGVLEPLTELDAAYKEALDAYEERWGQQRRRDLEEAYEEYAPDLMELVPLDRLIARHGSERGKGWLNRSTNVEAAKADMRAAIDAIAQGEQTLERSVDEEDLEVAKAHFFSTLDLGQAIQTAQARADQRERVRRLEEERKAREEAYRRTLEAERAAKEAEAARKAEEERQRAEREAANKPPQAPQAPQAPQVPYEKPTLLSREEAAAEWAATTPDMPVPNALRESVADAMGRPDPGKVPPYLMCCYGTQADADAFRVWCQQRGVKATVKPTGGRVYRITAR